MKRLTFLSEGSSYPWICRDGLRFRGFFYFESELYTGCGAAELLTGLLKDAPLPEALQRLNGMFSIIYEQSGAIWLASDHARALPLFYAVQGGGLVVSDRASLICGALDNVSFDDVSVQEFMATELFVTGHHTLFREIFQIQAGESVRFDCETGAIAREFYYSYESRVQQAGFAQLRKAFWQAYEGVGRRLVEALNGRTAVLSLSGGADSRMVAELLLKNGYDKIVCYTFGRPGCPDARIAQEYARQKKLTWNFIPYSRKLWKEAAKTKEFRDFLLFAGNYGSLPHIADYIAVKALIEQDAIPTDAVFVTGHCGDFFAGNLVSGMFMTPEVARDAFFTSIRSQFYQMQKLSNGVAGRMESYFPIEWPVSSEKLEAFSHRFNYRENHAKYCANSERVHDFFGFQWLLPLWDRELIDFWESVPLEWRYGRKLYFACVQKDEVGSTNDASRIKSVAAAVRGVPAVRYLVRRLSRIPQYFTYPLQFGGIVSFWGYLRHWAKGNELFGPKTVLNRVYLGVVQRKP